MSGALVDLVAIGVQDTYLTGEPQTTYFRQAYKRYTNFAIEPIRQVIEGQPIPGSWSQVNITRNGDLLSDVYFLCTETAAGGGSAMPCPYDEVQLFIGGQRIDTITDIETSAMFQQFANCLSHWGKAGNIGPPLVPTGLWTLPFFFSRDFSCSLPLCALQYHDVTLRIKWKDTVAGKPFDLYADYVQLDTPERNAFAAKPLTMLIEQHQKAPVEALAASATGYTSLEFSHPVKSIYFVAETGTGAWFELDATARITLNGKPRVPFLPIGNYYHQKQLASNTEFNIVGTGIGMYSFALWANRVTPTGSCNFSRIDNARFEVRNSAVGVMDANYIYALNWNFLKLEDGMGGLLFAN